MFRIRGLLLSYVVLAMLASRGAVQGADPATAVRGILVKPERVSPDLLARWKSKGATAVVVMLDESAKRRWAHLAEVVDRAGMTLWPWVEVARNPAMADAHPDWMAAVGGHHNDWRRRFPKAPVAKPGEIVKAWPWVPIGYAPAFEAHGERLKTLLADLPGTWSGAFLNDLQAGPSSCGCGNDQCRWALDYGTPATADKTPGDDAAAMVVAALRERHPGKIIVPVWVTECEAVDLPNAKGGTGLCGSVPCAKGDCWPRYVRSWDPLLTATKGPVAVALWPETFRRDPVHWAGTVLSLFQAPPLDGARLTPERVIAVVQAWEKPEAAVDAILERVKPLAAGWVIALDPIDQSWEPRTLPVRR